MHGNQRWLPLHRKAKRISVQYEVKESTHNSTKICNLAFITNIHSIFRRVRYVHNLYMLRYVHNLYMLRYVHNLYMLRYVHNLYMLRYVHNLLHVTLRT